MSDTHHVWDDDGGSKPPGKELFTSTPISQEKIDGRFVIVRTPCPLCGGRCSVKKSKGGYPLRYCTVNKKWIESVYVDR